ncbi:MAG TPA: hypothetical protein EYN96_00750 [Candidatus Hydrogenedentes bacterium]|nr:hypothetical protein [Candidatus Hydrogenedentota bacterium]
MNYSIYFRKRICLTACALLTVCAPSLTNAQQKSVEEESKVHRLTNTKRAIYDAFTYVNRIPEAPEAEETPLNLTGRIFGRLANQEGRILLKLPPGMDKETYISFKTFFRYEGDALIGDAKIGNCAACHTPAEFTDAKKHIVTKDGSPVTTPSLRNLDAREIDVAKIIRDKMKNSELKRSGNADEIDDAYAVIKLNEKDIAGLVKFLKLLNDGPDSEFRNLILGAELVDTSDMAEIN